MRSLLYLLPWFILSHLSWSLTIPPSINVYKRALTGENFVDNIGTRIPPEEEDLFWRQELEESLQVVRLIAQNALRVGPGHPLAALYFGGNQFYDLRTRIFTTIIEIIDNPPPHFRLVRAQAITGLPATTMAQVLYGEWVEGMYPELTGGARRAAVIHLYPGLWRLRELNQVIPLVRPGPARLNSDLNTRSAMLFHEFVHLASWMLDLDLQSVGFTAEFITALDATYGVEHPNDNQNDDQSSPTYPEQPDVDRSTDITGQIIEDLVPERFLTDQDDIQRFILDDMAPADGLRPVAYDTQRVQLVPTMHLGRQVAAMNAQNYAIFAVAAFRNQVVEPVDYDDPDEELQDAIDFAAGVGAPPSPSIREGEGWPNLNADLQNLGVRYMLAATEVWLDYDQLGSDFLKKGQ